MQRRDADAAGRVVSGRTGGGGAAKINASRPASQTHPRTHADQHAHAHEFDQINIAPGERLSVSPPPPKKEGRAASSLQIAGRSETKTHNQ